MQVCLIENINASTIETFMQVRGIFSHFSIHSLFYSFSSIPPFFYSFLCLVFALSSHYS